MISFETLTSEELKYICGQVPLFAVRQYFQKNPKAFAEIKPGFRSEKLSDAETFSVLLKNIGKPFIGSFLEKTVSKWLSEIRENRDRLVAEGYSEEEALLLTIPDSVFCDNCELFFKIDEQERSEEYIHLFREAMSLRQKDADIDKTEKQPEETQREKELLDVANNRIKDLEEQLQENNTRESRFQEEFNSLNDQLQKNSEELERIQFALEESENAKNEMQIELDHYRRLDSFSDEQYLQDDSSEFQHISIGQIYHDYNGQIWINRLADIIDGEIQPFILDDSAPRYFSNRDRVFWKDGPDKDGTIGIWSWRADPNHSDPARDYVVSEYNRYSKFTEVIELSQCKNLSEVAYALIEGIEKSFSGDKVLFTCSSTSGILEGLLCSTDNLKISGNKVKLLASAFMLPHYTIRPSDIINLEGLRIYRKMSLGIPQSVFRVRTPYDVVKKMLLSRVTIPALRENELTKKEAQRCKHFLESIPTESLVQELSDAYACTENEAKTYVDGFIEHADTYLTENDFDVNTLSLALARNTELVKLCKKQLTEAWEKDYSDRLVDAKTQLAGIEQNKEEKRKETELLLQKKARLDREILLAQETIDSTKKLASDVEEKTAQRIKAIQQNVADFITEMSFISPLAVSKTAIEDTQKQNTLSVFRSKMEHEAIESVDDIDTFEEELIVNFTLTGYTDEVAVEMAQAVSFCICNRLPVVIGKNSTSLAQCVAATIGGEELTEVFIGNESTVISRLFDLFEGNSSSYPLVYLIHGVFDGFNNNLFNELSCLIRRPGINAVVLLSLEGISPNMIFNSVWSDAFYIDGDLGLERFADGIVQALQPNLTFNRDVNNDEYKEKRKELLPFSSILSNIQICRYAKYLASYNLSINESPTILHQMIAVSRSSGAEETLRTLFHENGVNNGENLIDQYL